jgi:hypothetical protein
LVLFPLDEVGVFGVLGVLGVFGVVGVFAAFRSAGFLGDESLDESIKCEDFLAGDLALGDCSSSEMDEDEDEEDNESFFTSICLGLISGEKSSRVMLSMLLDGLTDSGVLLL